MWGTKFYSDLDLKAELLECFNILICYRENTMSRWSPSRSTLLSLLLDEVTGTKEEIGIRQDYCRIYDCASSTRLHHRKYYTGSKAEGLDLPGSDDDYMIDINDRYNIEVIQSFQEASNPFANTLILSTENVRPGFALLRMPRVPSFLWPATERINDVQYLSSNLMVQRVFNRFLSRAFIDHFCEMKRQGPSIEQFSSKDFEGIDNVRSIHCSFWPNVASDWRQRPRYFGWPTPSDISSIVSFGCHLVAIGHPHSETKFTEWRISFSIAERTLVWSFNHVQMQCYALMKIILKQFIKTKCSPENQVLCSYFIKTFLFWKFETTDLQFWRIDNLRECFIYLLNQFVYFLREGVLPHYFIPEFNLLSVKLTLEAQSELLQLFDIVIQNDITILKECRTLKTIWSKLLSIDENQMISRIDNIKVSNFLNTDEFMATKFSVLLSIIYGLSSDNIQNLAAKTLSSDGLFNVFSGFCTLVLQKSSLSLESLISQIITLPCKTDLKSIIIKQLLVDKCIKSLIEPYAGNKNVYTLNQICNNELSSLDISTSKLWYAIILLKKRDFTSALSIVNQLLSSIPPFALYVSRHDSFLLPETSQLYVDMFMNSSTTIERARKAWLMPLRFEKCMADIVPLAIQIELYFCDFITLSLVTIQPLAMTHYLAFQCYHELGQYDHRDNALCQLVDFVNNDAEKDNSPEQLFNIAGHCLLIAGDQEQARDMLSRSKQAASTYERIPFLSANAGKCSSANWYLEHFC